jgi:hypothetical protein
MTWKPTLRQDVDLKSLPLSPTQGYVASRVDGATDVHALAQLTGLSDERVETVLRELVALGAVVAPIGNPAIPPPEPVTEPANEMAPEPETEAEAEVVTTEAVEPDDAAEDVAAETQQTHRALYASQLRELSQTDREARARLAVDPELSALCFDPLPAVVHALLENPRFGPVHARLVAANHHGQGLDALTARSHFAADGGVRRALLKNPQLNAALYRRLWGHKRLLEQFKVCISRELAEQVRKAARETMRAHFGTAAAEERVELIMKTEGRCLQMLVGLPLDSKTTALLCAKQFGSTQLVQNLARWGPTPPQLIAHLLKQELVRRSPTLRTLLERHPNAP